MPQKIFLISENQDKNLKQLTKKLGHQFESETWRALLTEKCRELKIQ